MVFSDGAPPPPGVGDAGITGEGEEKQCGSFCDAGGTKGGEGGEVALLHC